MLPSDMLREEHRVIERMLAVLNRAADRLDEGEKVDARVFESAVDFIRNYADRYHHAKEEDGLFVAMQKHGIPRNGGPIGMMLMEHDEGRGHVRGMVEALQQYPTGNGAASGALAQHARGFADLLAAHIYKEDNILYPMGDQVLPQEAQQQLLQQFVEAEQRVLSSEGRQRYLGMVDDLEKTV